MMLLTLAALAAAQPIQCDPDGPQQAMNACARDDFERADRQLNAVWPQVLAAARAADAEINREFDQAPTSEQVLREAQRAWLVFRDAHCTYEGHESRGGSMEPLLYEGCRAHLTQERIKQLTQPGIGDSAE